MSILTLKLYIYIYILVINNINRISCFNVIIFEKRIVEETEIKILY